MNLYRSFGNLLETWVTDGYPALDLQGTPQSEVSVDEEVEVPEGEVPDHTHAFRSGSRDSLRFSGTTARSESEDSGVELLSATSTWSAQQHAKALRALEASSAGQSEGLDGDQKEASEGADHHHHHCLPTCPSSPALSIHSCPSSPSSTSSSSSSFQSIGTSLSPVGAIDSPSGLRVEQALRRVDPSRRQSPRRGFSLATRGAQTPQSKKRSNTINSSTSSQASRGQRPASFEPGEEQTLSYLPQTNAEQTEGEIRYDQADPDSSPASQLRNRLGTQQSETSSSPVPSRLQAQASGTGEVGWAELSPGFLYLEQMIRMLEKLAQLKMVHRGLQTETEQLRSQQSFRRPTSAQSSTSSHSSSLRSTESLSQILENRINQEDEETLLEGHDILFELRHRSLSDAARLAPHRYNRTRSRSIGDLLEEDEEETFRTDASESQQQEQQERRQQRSESARQGSSVTRGLRHKITSLRRNEAGPDPSDGRSQTLPRLGKKPSLKGLTKFFKIRSKSST